MVALVSAQRLPTMFPWRAYVELGGLMLYAPAGSQSVFHHRSAQYVDRILKGLPVEQPVKFDLVVNMKTAQELQLVVPSALLLQATGFVQ